MTAAGVTPGRVARRAWRIRPSLLELAVMVAAVAVVRLVTGFPVWALALGLGLGTVAVAVVTAASELRSEERAETAPEQEGVDDPEGGGDGGR